MTFHIQYRIVIEVVPRHGCQEPAGRTGYKRWYPIETVKCRGLAKEESPRYHELCTALFRIIDRNHTIRKVFRRIGYAPVGVFHVLCAHDQRPKILQLTSADLSEADSYFHRQVQAWCRERFPLVCCRIILRGSGVVNGSLFFMSTLP